MIGSLEHPVWSFGLPADAVAWACALLAILVIVIPRRFRRFRARPTLICLMIASAVLSFAYFEFYLGGGPRVIDATAYLLEARTFAHGAFSFEVPEPSANFRGRFLIHTAADAHRLAPIFPPGYPALLSLAVHLGSFKLLGPLLAAALIYVTYRLGLSLTGRKRDALVAATFSMLCACLRYHTAETMSHGAAALLTAIATWTSVEIIRSSRILLKKCWFFLGLSVGALIATRQLTGILVALSCLGSISLSLASQSNAQRSSRETRNALTEHLPGLALFALALLPGIALLLAHHHAVTGDFFTSPQTRYYRFADGPSDCFGIGLGKGCQYEHGDVVAQQGGQGLTLFWALKNTLHRLHWHSLDIANFEPLILVALFAAWKFRKRTNYRVVFLILISLPLGYAFFYFNGSYPGGGARFFSELLPLWHVLLATGLCCFRSTARNTTGLSISAPQLGMSAALLGFSLHASFSHRLLLGPHFGPDASHLSQIESELDRRAPVSPPGTPNPTKKALVFFSPAHLFNAASLSSSAFIAARRTRDAREDYLVKTLQPSSAWIFETIDNHFTLTPFTSSTANESCTLRLESEFDYPPLGAHEVWTHPEYVSASCISAGRALRLQRTGPAPRLVLETLPGHFHIELVGLDDNGTCRAVSLSAAQSFSAAPTGQLELNLSSNELAGFSHLDHLLLTPPHCAKP